MKALVYVDNQTMEYRDEPDPCVTDQEVLVAIESVGICGSDMHAYLGHDPRRVPPLVLGHEAVGTVMQGAAQGKKVVLNPLITCGRCNDCLYGRQNLCEQRDLIGMYRPGAFAEKIVMPETNLIEIPESMDINKAALTEPGATSLHAILLAEKTLSRPISEAKVLVVGSGSVGLLAALLLQDKGVSELEIAETNPLRRATVKEHTQCKIFDPLKGAPKENYYDLVFDAVGAKQTREISVACARPGSIIAHIGLMDNMAGLDMRRMTLQEITLIGCYTYSPLDLRMTLEKLYSGALGDLEWIEKRPLDEGARAFEDIHKGQCAAPKVVLNLI